ncbi:MAG: hypothetical protein CMP65_05050 [Flavobacteriales bacterium]|nr:hypothetical protein [Flavobacteriales bacterium]
MTIRTFFLLLFSIYFNNNFLFAQADIVGGEDADIQDYPYQVALGNSSFGSFFYAFCGASIINEYWVLTAAHCVQGENPNNTAVRVGSDSDYAQGGTIYQADQIIIHENYSNNGNNWDIALIRLEDPISFNNNTQPVLLVCDQQVELGVEDPGQMSWITGWGNTEGTTNSSQLQVVGVPITEESNYWGGVEDDEIMAGYPNGGYDSCQGDSGGPMVVLAADGETYLQVGIVSWGSGCAEPGYPGVYSRVSYFIDWICENTNGDVCANQSTFCTDENAVYGCTDLNANNYNPDATIDNGSCEYPCDNNVNLSLQLDCYGEEISWEIINQNGAIVAEVSSGTYPGGSTADTMEEGGSLQEQEICLSAGCYTFIITDSYGDGLSGSEFTCTVNGTPFSITSEDGIMLFQETNPAFGDCITGGDSGPCSASYEFCVDSNIEIILGCIDPLADNYDPQANTNDNSCIYLGCTDESAFNFDENANTDDGSCIPIIVGCTDQNADNYNPNANTDNGDCEYSYEWQSCSNQTWFEDFESYSNNSSIDNQSNEWFGWDGLNSNVNVISTGFNNSNQSILVEQDDDLLHSFGEISSGIGEIIFWMYIPSSGGAGAYYNILHDYNENDSQNSIWAHQITFASSESGDQSVIDAGGYEAVFFDAIYDTWVEVRQEIDIDSDNTSLYYNGELLYTWQFSLDAGGEQQLNILDAINFYGYCTGNGCTGEAWYDNLEICGFDDNTNMIENNNINITIYPNPNHGSFSILLDKNIEKFSLQITDILGKEVLKQEVDTYVEDNNKEINLNVEKGTYLINIENEKFKKQEIIIIN